MEGRKQFTFYRSFYEAIGRLEPKERTLIYDILLPYALDGVEPDLDALPGSVAVAFLLIKPTLDSSRKKAASGKRGGEAESKSEATCKQTESSMQANRKQTASKKEKEAEVEKEVEKEVETETEYKKESYINPLTPFMRFWQAYPRKEGRAEAERVFAGVRVPVETLLTALEKQKGQPAWQKEAGRYIPSPAKWLAGKRWEDVPASPPVYQMGELELQAMRRMLAQDFS